ncbi:glutathione peroxidase [Psychrobacillus lasiicapitis]|uniref:Glutathione peroxidase n=1 Tax=Psychrobacillus lasiicapitis TaxID=1636719 RepID=A0A544SQS6_9BACI|nr:glutathione peroxidase [Psychrobacillus lasiicapitis]TQR07557.1 glutathione peroxidase [Psychrobacillus lasiicapitis]GGA50133.1 glutathione peroxidase [Psychrobacillus lasiicapitis]
MTSVYEFTAKNIKGEDVPLSKYKGKPLIIVNTASHCGFTPQFTELQTLYEKYHDQGLEILGFPCSQFNNQEFEDMDKTLEYCQLNHGVTFPMFAKIDVKGNDIHPLFQYLITQQKGFLSDGIKWNFTKFLIDKEGNVVGRYAPQTPPLKMERDILKMT